MSGPFASVSRVLALAAPLSLLAAAPSHAAPAQSTRIVSLDSSQNQGADRCDEPSMSADGARIAYQSDNDFAASDKNGRQDIYLRDNVTGAATLISHTPSGNAGNSHSYLPHISGDGRVVVFESHASDLVLNDTNSKRDVFHWVNSTVTRISVDTAGNEGNDDSSEAATNDDGTIVAFESDASNLDANDNNGKSDIFVRDLNAGVTRCITLNELGDSANGFSRRPSISGDGQSVVFHSSATDLIKTDLNSTNDVFLYTPADGIIRLSEDASGVGGNSYSTGAILSRSGQFVVFTSLATNLVSKVTNADLDVYLYDVSTGQLTRESVTSDEQELSGSSTALGVSDDGRYVLFSSSADELPHGPGIYQQTYVRDRQHGITYPVSVATDGSQGNGACSSADIAATDLLIAFTSTSTNLIPSDQNGLVGDVFLREPGLASWQLYGAGHPGTNGVPALSLISNPVLGTQPTLVATRSSPNDTTGFFLVGTQPASIPSSWDGTFLVNFSLILVLPLNKVNSSFPFSLDTVPEWEGVSIYIQMLELDAGASSGISFSRGLKMELGY